MRQSGFSHLERVERWDTVLLSHAEKAYSSRRAQLIGPTAYAISALKLSLMLFALHNRIVGTSVAGLPGKAFLSGSRTRAVMTDGTAHDNDSWQYAALPAS
jgi:hypothetical protein